MTSGSPSPRRYRSFEPVNSRDVPGFFVDRSRVALDIIAAVGSANLKLQYDIYYAQVMEGLPAASRPSLPA
jgi:hydroxypyruvate isomerase